MLSIIVDIGVGIFNSEGDGEHIIIRLGDQYSASSLDERAVTVPSPTW
jgi:hypothetical protein